MIPALRIADCGLRIGDCGLRIANGGLRTANCGLRIANCGMRIVALALVATTAFAQERPAVGPERPFQLAPRVEKTLPNGLRVIVTRQTAIPKVTVMLTVLSGYSSDPA